MERNDYHVNSVQRAIAILKCFSAEEAELGLADVSLKAGLPKATTRRFLLTLTDGGMLQQDPGTGKYSIGLMFYTVGNLYLNTNSLLKVAAPVVKTLNELTSECVNIGILHKHDVVLIMREEPRYAFRFAAHLGTVIPVYASAIGRAILSELTDEELNMAVPEEELRPVTARTITTKSNLKLELGRVRKTGISIGREDAFEGVEGIASVIYDAQNKVVAGLSIVIPVFRIDDSKREKLITLVRLGCELISYRLGYQHVTNPISSVQDIISWWEQNK
jgi:DNA-binding IclR family transcriptional regulator